MKLTYWVAECLNDSKHYNIRKRTKKEVMQTLEGYNPGDYSPPRKVTVEYDDGFDLLTQCTYEGWGWWESEGGQ